MNNHNRIGFCRTTRLAVSLHRCFRIVDRLCTSRGTYSECGGCLRLGRISSAINNRFRCCCILAVIDRSGSRIGVFKDVSRSSYYIYTVCCRTCHTLCGNRIAGQFHISPIFTTVGTIDSSVGAYSIRISVCFYINVTILNRNGEILIIVRVITSIYDNTIAVICIGMYGDVSIFYACFGTCFLRQRSIRCRFACAYTGGSSFKINTIVIQRGCFRAVADDINRTAGHIERTVIATGCCCTNRYFHYNTIAVTVIRIITIVGSVSSINQIRGNMRIDHTGTHIDFTVRIDT